MSAVFQKIVQYVLHFRVLIVQHILKVGGQVGKGRVDVPDRRRRTRIPLGKMLLQCLLFGFAHRGRG